MSVSQRVSDLAWTAYRAGVTNAGGSSCPSNLGLRLADPVDAGYYGPVAPSGCAHTPTTSAVWGAWGDRPWPQADRVARLGRHCARLRAAGFDGLADLVWAYAHNPDDEAVEARLAEEAFRVALSAWRAGACEQPVGPKGLLAARSRGWRPD